MGRQNFLEFRPEFSYEKALRYQGLLSYEGYSGLLAFSPSPTITLGLGSDGAREILVSREMLSERKIEVIATDRGGKATYHGPGQLVGFPILNLQNAYGDKRAVRRFSEDLLPGLAHACAGMGLRSVETRAGYPGLWTSRGKLASVGIAVKDGYVFHGFAINVTQEAVAGFSLIQPCGIPNCTLTSFEAEGVKVDCLEKFARELAPYLGSLFAEGTSLDSPALRYDRKFDDIVARVQRSPVALDYYYSNLGNVVRD